MKTKYRIGEVEKLLGVPRSTIRYYIKEGLLSVDKEDTNGYYYYTKKDLRNISHLIVGRNRLELGLVSSRSRTELESLEDYHKLLYQQENKLFEQLASIRRSIDLLQIYERMLVRIKNHLGKFSIVDIDVFYIFPEFYALNSKTSVIDVGFVSSVFVHKNDRLVYDSLISIVHKSDAYLVSKEDMENSNERKDLKCVFTVLKSTKDIESAELLDECIAWAESQHIPIKPPYYLSYLTELRENGKKIYYYEIYLPFHAAPKLRKAKK